MRVVTVATQPQQLAYNVPGLGGSSCNGSLEMVLKINYSPEG